MSSSLTPMFTMTDKNTEIGQSLAKCAPNIAVLTATIHTVEILRVVDNEADVCLHGLVFNSPAKF